MARARRVRAFVARYKALCGCLLCGERTPELLDAHHMVGKDGVLADKRTITSAKRELRKCVILCANHHRAVHLTDMRLLGVR